LSYKDSNCPAKLHILTCGSFLTDEHSHAPNPEKVTARKIISQGKELAKESRLATNTGILDRMRTLTSAENLDGVHLGSTNNLKRRLRYTRFQTFGHSNLGDSLGELQLPASFQKNLREERFLLYDNHGNDNRMLIFATDDALDKLSYCKTWLVDGTFKTCPNLFGQLYTIHGLFRDTVAIPFVFAYLPGKSQGIYAEFFRKVRQHTHGEPELIISDFEIAAINACRDQFMRTTEMGGCLFHLTQSIFRRIQGNPEVYERYRANTPDGAKVRKALRSIGALAFLRTAEVWPTFSLLRGQFAMGDSVREIFSYFQENYLGYDFNDVRFPIPFWNVRERFLSAQPRTNNQKEGWHYRFKNMHSKSNPTMETSLQMIQKEELHWYQECQKILGGIVPRKKKKSIQIETRLENIMKGEDRDYKDKIEFLGAIQQCLHEFVRE
jgi:hypothetical protein